MLLVNLLVILLLLVLQTPVHGQSPAPPTLLSPANGTVTDGSTYPPLGIPLFEWAAVAGATRYEIEIDDDANFTDAPRIIIDGDLTFYAPARLNYLAGGGKDGTYYWHVRTVVGGDVGAWSATWSFSKQWAAASIPTLLAPDDFATIEFFEDPIFSWQPVLGAARYLLEVDDDPNFNSKWLNQYTIFPYFTPTSRPTNGIYYWRVTAYDVSNHAGTPSPARTVTVDYQQVPTLLEPANYAQPEFTPTFRWTAVKGAWNYKLQYGTTSNFQAGTYTEKIIANTTYTPHDSLPNDVNYYWRVCARYGTGVDGPWSEVRSFLKQWHTGLHRTRLLTPRDNNIVNHPYLFSWTPVREAAYYKLKVCYDTGCVKTLGERTVRGTTVCDHKLSTPKDVWGTTMYWRVTPYDNSNNPGAESDWGSYRPRYWNYMAELVSPRYYYDPPSAYVEDDTRQITVHHVVTSPIPTFAWTRVFSQTYNEVDHFLLQVGTHGSLFVPPYLQWDYETQNPSATPTDVDPFTPTASVDYYWRVLAYDEYDRQIGIPSEVWKTRIDASLQVTPTAAISLSYPLHGQEIIEVTPAMRWLPMQGAAGYLVEVHREPDCGDSAVYSTTTRYVEHSPPVRLPPGTYFWRVHALDAGGALTGSWSPTRRFLIEFQSRWKRNRWTSDVAPDPASEIMPVIDNTLIATDTVEGGNTHYDLKDLYAGRDEDNWYIGFHIVTATSGSPVRFGLYLDINQDDGQGADVAPPNSPVITAPLYHRPEIALYVTRDAGGSLDTSYVAFHEWDLILEEWDPDGAQNLLDVSTIGGAMYYSSTTGYVELRIPKTPLGNPGSLSIALFTAESGSATLGRDTVPDSGEDASAVERFASLADRVTLFYPDRVPLGGGVGFGDSPILAWQTPDMDYFRGYRVELALEEDFSPLYTWEEEKWEDGAAPWVDLGGTNYTSLDPLPNNTYFWRVKVMHRDENLDFYGEPTEPMFFVKVGLVPGNLQTSVDYTVPTFSWDSVEGAGSYKLEVADNPEFNNPRVNQLVNHNQYTPNADLDPGTWYWRVRVKNGSYEGEPTEVLSFTLTLPAPVLTWPGEGAVIAYGPTFQWQTVLTPTAQPIFHPRLYRLQVCTDESCTASAPGFPKDTQTTSYTSDSSLEDRDAYYWRVAVIDAWGNLGPYSPVRSFTKQGASVTLVSPSAGTPITTTPIFRWEPVTGAARYEIQVAQNEHFSPIFDSGNVHNAFFAPTRVYDSLEQYWWHVRACDYNNRCGPWEPGVIPPGGNFIYLPLVLRSSG
jgi:hypothetical protein